MKGRLYLVRHGETEGAEAKQYKGSIDVPLSENGINHIKALAVHLRATVPIKAVYSSDLIRSRKSAEILSEPFGLAPVVVEGLREWNFGHWEGLSFSEVEDKYPAEFKAWASNPHKHGPTGGESTIEVKYRAVNAVDQIFSEHVDEDIVIVAHGGVNRLLLCEFLGIPLENIFRIEQDFGALNILEFSEGYPSAKLINFSI
jgi:alpha-ribazole phosphatase/probable phosphoglycerate mutase